MYSYFEQAINEELNIMQVRNMVGQLGTPEIKTELKSMQAHLDVAPERILDAILKIVNALKLGSNSDEKKYLAWIVKQLNAGELLFMTVEEDGDVILKNLLEYVKYRKDWGKLESLTYSDIKELVSENTPDATLTGILESPIATMGIWGVYEISDWQVIMKVGAGTSWCIQGETWAKKYSKTGKFYLITKKGRRHILLHFQEGQFMDVKDNQISLNMMKEFRDAWSGFDYMARLVYLKQNTYQNKMGNAIGFMNNVTAKEVKKSLEVNTESAFYVPPQMVSQEVWMDEITKAPANVLTIDRSVLTSELCEYAITKSPTLIDKLPQELISDEIWMKGFDKSPAAMIAIMPEHLQTDDAWRYAFERTAVVILRMPEHLITDKTWEEAIERDPQLLFNSDMSEEKKRIAVKADPYALFRTLVQRDGQQSEEVNLLAVAGTSRNLQSIKNPSEQVLMAAAENSNSGSDINTALGDREPSEALQLAMVNGDSDNFRFISNPTRRVCIIAVSKYAEYYRHLPEEYQREKAFQYLCLMGKYGFRAAYQITEPLRTGTPDEDIQMLMVTGEDYSRGYNIKQITSPCEKAQFLSVWAGQSANTVDNLQDIDPQMSVPQLAAVIKNPGRAIAFVKKPFPDTVKYVAGITAVPNLYRKFKNLGVKREQIVYDFKKLSPEAQSEYQNDVKAKINQIGNQLLNEVEAIRKHAQQEIDKLLAEARTPAEEDSETGQGRMFEHYLRKAR